MGADRLHTDFGATEGEWRRMIDDLKMRAQTPVSDNDVLSRMTGLGVIAPEPEGGSVI